MSIRKDVDRFDKAYVALLAALATNDPMMIGIACTEWGLARSALADQLKTAATEGNIKLVKALDELVKQSFESISKDVPTLIDVRPKYLLALNDLNKILGPGLISKLVDSGTLKIGGKLLGVEAAFDIKKFLMSFIKP
jgi:hypothetical protein